MGPLEALEKAKEMIESMPNIPSPRADISRTKRSNDSESLEESGGDEEQSLRKRQKTAATIQRWLSYYITLWFCSTEVSPNVAAL